MKDAAKYEYEIYKRLQASIKLFGSICRNACDYRAPKDCYKFQVK